MKDAEARTEARAQIYNDEGFKKVREARSALIKELRAIEV